MLRIAGGRPGSRRLLVSYFPAASLGTMNFGPLTSEADAHAIMDAALEYGINFFDTANAYGLRSAGVSGLGEGKGSTESIIGCWFAQGGGRREKTVLATKLHSGMGEWPNDGKLSAMNIRREPYPVADRLHRPLPVPPC